MTSKSIRTQPGSDYFKANNLITSIYLKETWTASSAKWCFTATTPPHTRHLRRDLKKGQKHFHPSVSNYPDIRFINFILKRPCRKVTHASSHPWEHTVSIILPWKRCYLMQYFCFRKNIFLYLHLTIRQSQGLECDKKKDSLCSPQLTWCCQSESTFSLRKRGYIIYLFLQYILC